MTTKTRIYAVGMLAAALLGAPAASAQPAPNAAGPTAPVSSSGGPGGVSVKSATATVKVTTQRMSGATLHSTQYGSYSAGSRLSLSCAMVGQAVKGYYSPWMPRGGWDTIWYKVSDGKYVADIDINTGSQKLVTGLCSGSQSLKAGHSVEWAASMLGSNSYNNLCQKFVENAYGTGGQYGSAKSMYYTLRNAGKIHTTGTPPVGSLVFSELGSTYGHVQISTNDGSATPYISGGVSTWYGNRTTVQRMPKPRTYVGWAYAPSSWPGR